MEWNWTATDGAVFKNPAHKAYLISTRSTKQSSILAELPSISNIVEIFNPYDVNNDGSVDISDVVSLVNFILDSSTTNSSYDVNGDGNIDISDVVALVNMILGQQ
jgi:Ca2+-binding EF-hand superfamily protein